MDRTAVNPWDWSLQFGFSQAHLVEAPTRMLLCSGQTSVDGEGTPQHAGDMPAQIALAMDNVEAVLGAAGMTLSDVIRLNMYTTDVDEFLAHLGPMNKRLALAGVAPASTLLGVARLAFPILMIELEATAIR